MRDAIRLLMGTIVVAMTPVIDAQSVPTPVKRVTETKVIKPDLRYEFSRGVSAGRVMQKVAGKAGQVITTYEISRKNGKTVKRAVYCKTTPAQDTVMVIGSGGYTSSRGSFSGRKIMTMNASGYDPYPPGGSGTGKTATGIMARFGICAVDPRVIPLGTLLYVEGYGMALAADTGGAIKGAKIDLCFNTRAEAYKWGRKNVKVHVLREKP